LSALLMRLLHITGGAVAVAGGIIPAILAINMVAGPGKKAVEEIQSRKDPNHLAVYPLAVPYRLLVLGLVLLVLAFDYLIFANIDKLAKRLKPTGLVISEVSPPVTL
jgi:small neutral amino acid transporter SnatA (MarC family)